ncbi:MAG: deoxyribodipyrimidine photo-lyase [Rariglobus sp.]
MSKAPVIVWFRQDLRLRDNAALQAALARGGPVIAVYIHDDAGEGDWPAGGASRWWLHHSLAALDASLRERGSRLLLRVGASGEALSDLITETGAEAVYWNRRYEPTVIARDKAIKADLVSVGVEAKSFNSSLLFEPHTITNKQGSPYQVFTPYWRHCLTLEIAPPVSLKSGDFPAIDEWPSSVALDDLKLLPTIKWDAGFYDEWTPGEAGAQKQLKAFIAQAMSDYEEQRNVPSEQGTSRLSAHLHFGELGPRQIWAAVRALSKDSGVFPPHRGGQVYLTEIGWREFAHHLLFHFPQTPKQPLRENFRRFPWAADKGGNHLRAWQRGQTGYPIVDAGMRELWHTGWMHNRVRMIVASFLVKHLRLSWNHGAEWFWDTLVDADLANNTLGWQWSAGCGADAAPYFRIFAPVTQGEKFDGEGVYVRRWVPEIAKLPNKYLHAPWTAPADVLVRAGVKLGENYPAPIVDHAKTRVEALEAFKQLKNE